jgi:hypothetical protein
MLGRAFIRPSHSIRAVSSSDTAFRRRREVIDLRRQHQIRERQLLPGHERLIAQQAVEFPKTQSRIRLSGRDRADGAPKPRTRKVMATGAVAISAPLTESWREAPLRRRTTFWLPLTSIRTCSSAGRVGKYTVESLATDVST